MESPDQGGFHRGDVDFAVTLAGMSVADEQQRARCVHRNVKCRAGDQLLVVEIARVNSGRRTVDASRGRRRRDADAAKEWTQWNLDAIGKMRDHAFRIERDDAHLRVGKIFGDSTAARAERVVGIRNRQPDLFDSDFEHVTRFRALDENRPGENVPARTFVGYFSINVAQ